ncbi:uncharacterized protein LOC143664558 isoform X1 [Tamandua tetradactyla]|uniref:uncharacterized protein LOC143664558 isoform X1 n=1 Tax=Tamandua tetradactyla TaxID=48850 RepID=UPI004054904A
MLHQPYEEVHLGLFQSLEKDPGFNHFRKLICLNFLSLLGSVCNWKKWLTPGTRQRNQKIQCVSRWRKKQQPSSDFYSMHTVWGQSSSTHHFIPSSHCTPPSRGKEHKLSY